MQVTQEQISPCEVGLRIEVEADKVNAAVDETYKELSKVTKVPGFRPGKAPRAILERVVGEDRVKDQAADKLIQPAYSEALKETNVEPWAPADVELVEFELGKPLIFTAKVPLAPKVELGEYKGLDIERTVPPVTDEMVDAEIKGMLERQAKFEPVTDRGAEEGNTAVFEMKDEEVADEEPKRQVVSIGENLPDFDAGLKGMKVDEEKSIKVTYPEDFATEELRGQTKTFAVKMVEIYDRQLPELSDEWVKTTFAPAPKEGEEPPADAVDTVDKLKGKIREAMEKSAQDIADRDVNDSIITKVVENSQIDFPEVMVAERVDERLHELQEELKNRKLNIEDYLKHANKNLNELRAEFAEEAKQGLKVNLAIYEIVDKEEIKVEDADIDEEIKSMADARNVPAETVRAYLDSTDGTATIKYRLLRKKVLDFLAGASNIKSVG